MRTVAACCIMASPSCWAMANTIESQSANVEITASDGEQKETNPLEGFWKKTWIRKKGDSQKAPNPSYIINTMERTTWYHFQYGIQVPMMWT